MSSKNYDCKPLQWDTDYFGINSARINLNGVVDILGQEEIIAFCNEYDFVTISNLENLKENNYWIGNKTSAIFVDMNVQFIKTLEDIPSYQDDKTYVVNRLSKNNQIIDIAKKSFKYSRFFNDPRLPEKRAKSIYIHWTECAFEQEDKYFVISKNKGEVAGYILFSLDEKDCVIELIAVDKKYQGQGVGKRLIQTLESFVLEQRISKIKVGTQIDNVSAVQFYSKMGFVYESCRSIYHLWSCS